MSQSFFNLWVGAFIKTDALILYDPNLQIDGHEWVNLYSVNKDDVRPFEKNVVRKKIRRANYAEYARALHAYAAWAQRDNGSFVAVELLTKGREQKQQSIDSIPRHQQEKITRHQEFLRKFGKSAEAIIVEPRWDRATHCHSCRSPISMPSLQCNSCRWIICQCGACGCGY